MGKAESNRINGKKGGRPKGKLAPKTLEKMAVLSAFRQRAMKVADTLFNAQLTLARGQTFLYKIPKQWVPNAKGNGGFYKSLKPRIVTDQSEIETYLERGLNNVDDEDDNDPGATYYFITTKEPNNQAAEAILDRTFGKSIQGIELGGPGGKDLFDKNADEAADEVINKFINNGSPQSTKKRG